MEQLTSGKWSFMHKILQIVQILIFQINFHYNGKASAVFTNAFFYCSLELYFKQLCDDMDVYSKHAKRRTIEKEDLELLMKR